MSDNYFCVACTEVFYYPVTFPCNHSMCKQCFDAHVSNNGLFCHLCRKRLGTWLRKVKMTNAEIVDSKLWAKVQKRYPKLVKARRLEISNPQTSQNNLTPEKIPHEDRKIILAKPGEVRTEYEEWLLQQEKMLRLSEEKNLSLSAELIKIIEAEEMKEKEEHKKLMEQQLILDEELARKLLEAENLQPNKVSEEQKKMEEQLALDEELARKLLEDEHLKANEPITTTANDKSSHTDTSKTSLCADKKDSRRSLFKNSETPSLTGHAQQSCFSPLDKSSKKSPPTKNHPSSDIFVEYFTGPSTSKAGCYLPIESSPVNCSSEDKLLENCTGSSTSKFETKPMKQTSLLDNSTEENSSEDVSDLTPRLISLSNKKLSHFVSVSTSSSSGTKNIVEVTPSRCSSGDDSINKELCHFKPICKSPTTPLKDGQTGIPQFVVAQKMSSSLDLNFPACHDVIAAISNPDSDLSVEDLEESLARENQLEADRLLALKLQDEWNVSSQLESSPSPSQPQSRKRRGTVALVSSDYNLRKKKKKDLRKKVLLDITQTTLDSMLIK